MLLLNKTFTATTPEDLDRTINAFIGRQIYNGITVYREVKFTNFYISAGTLYEVIVYSELNVTGT